MDPAGPSPATEALPDPAAPVAARPAATAGLGRMAAVAIGVFVLTFSLVPAYRIACEKIFGIRLERGAAADTSGAAAGQRTVRIEFDGGVNSRLPWVFSPEQLTMEVVPGQLYEASYVAMNTSEQTVVGSAVPSVAPARASGYFSKTECFCFTAQTLEPGQTRQMPVRFIVDPDLPAGIHTLTLSYTFFRNDALTDELAAGTASNTAHAAP
ncbi:cytochrome c oxidase assembly protein [Stenotrophomonas ginsengisoli]